MEKGKETKTITMRMMMMSGWERIGTPLAVAATLVLGGPQLVTAHPGHQGETSEHELTLAQGDGAQSVAARAATSGSGKWAFRVASEYRLPAKAQERINSAHGGFAVDPKTKDLYFGLKGVGVVRLGPQPGDSEIINGFPELANGNLHNVTLFYHQGKPILSCPDNETGHVYLLDLEEETLRTLDRPEVNQYYQDGGSFNPTDTEFAKSTLYVTDGYSAGNFVLMANPFRPAWHDGFFGGKGAKHGRFGTCHGVTHNREAGTIAIADRPHSRIERFNFKHKYLESVTLPEGSWPCDVDFLDGRMVVGCLFGPEKSTPAPIYIMDRGGKVISTIRPKKDLGFDKAKHIHNATWWVVPSKNGDSKKVMIAVTAWNPGDFFILERTAE